MSQNEDAIQEETPAEEEAVNHPEETEQPEPAQAPADEPEVGDEADDDTSQEEVEDASSSAPSSDHTDEDADGDGSQDEPAPEGASAGEPAPEDDPLFLSPEDDDGEEFEVVTSDAPVIEVIDAPPVRDPKDDRIAELESRLAEAEQLQRSKDEEISGLQRERDDLKARLLRSAADMDNFRKRKEREKEELRKYGSDKIIADLLPAVDNLERALEHAQKTEEESSISDGVRMVHRQIVSSLEKHGITSFESVGEKFDPQRHEAIQQIETTEFDTNVVMQEFQKGYFIHDRLLRPALTVVAKRIGPPPEEVAPEPEEEPAEEAGEATEQQAHEPATEQETSQEEASAAADTSSEGLGAETSHAQA